METLAAIYVVLVTFANALAPQADIPRVLGVKIAQNTATSTPSGETIRSTVKIKGILEEVRAKREELLRKAKEKRDAAKAKITTKRGEFRKKLSEMKDARKQKVVENIDSRIASHNEKWVEQWNKVLSRLSEILEKIKNRTESAKADGKNVSTVETAIASAESAISAAQAAVNAQSAKTYIITIGTDENLGENVSATVRGFKKDVMAVIEKVRAARKAVVSVFRELAKVLGEEEKAEDEATPSPSASPAPTATP